MSFVKKMVGNIVKKPSRIHGFVDGMSWHSMKYLEREIAILDMKV